MRSTIVRIVEPKGTNLVTQANKLIEARYSATKNELIIIFIMMSFIDPKDSEFLTFKTSIPQLADFMRVDRKSMKRELKSIVERLLSRVVEIETPNGWKMHQWISYAEANYKEDSLELRFHDHLKPHLLGLKKYFNSLDVFSFLDFKSVYTLRMYHLLRDFDGQQKSTFTYELTDYRKIVLGGRKQDLKKYPLFNNFKNRVLELSKKELDKKSMISFSYKTIRIGRSIGKIEFTIIKKNQPKKEPQAPALPPKTANDQDKPKTQEVKEMISLGVPIKQARELLEQYGADYITEKLRFTAEKERDNPAGFFIKALKLNWGNKEGEIKAQKQAKEEERQKKEQAKRRREAIETARRTLEDNYADKVKKEYLAPLSKEEKAEVFEEIKKENVASIPYMKNIETGLGGALLTSFIQKQQDDYEKNKQIFINTELQKMGLIKEDDQEAGK